MGKIIEPNKDFLNGFIKFVKAKYKDKEFSVSEAANSYFQKRYKTKDKWTDPKNVTGAVKRMHERDETFEFVGVKKSKSTGFQGKHYRIRSLKNGKIFGGEK